MTDPYIYAALFLSKLGKPITGESLVNILRAGGIEADTDKASSLAKALDGVDVVTTIKNAGAVQVATPSEPLPEAKKEAPKTEQSEEEAWGIGKGLTDLFK